ncbi:MAG: MBL fold metallo-hydrolase, partial [Rhodothermales bacterium]
MLTGRGLFEDVERARGEAAFWWLGQHSFIVTMGGAVLLIDPYLNEDARRNVPPLFHPVDAADVVDAVLCTHDHTDHIDPAAIPGLAEETGAHFVAPAAHKERMRSLGVPEDR